MRKNRKVNAAKKFIEDHGLYTRLIISGIFLFGAYLIISVQPLFMPTFITAVIGCISSIIYFLHKLPVPFEGFGRFLEPFELIKEERKVLSFLKGEAGKINVIKTTIGIALILVLFELMAPKKPVYNHDVARIIMHMSAVLVIFWFTARYVAQAMNILIAYKNWDLIQMTIEPWPIDKPYRTPIFSKRKELGIEEYRRLLMEVSEEDDSVKGFLRTHPFENLALFFKQDWYSEKNLRMISELESPTEYFDFLEKLAERNKYFSKFAMGILIGGLYSRLKENPRDYYNSYERVLLKAEGNLLDEFKEDGFLEFFLENVEYVLGKIEKDPNWKVKVEKICSILSRYELKELMEKLPETLFGLEFKNIVEMSLEKKPKKK